METRSAGSTSKGRTWATWFCVALAACGIAASVTLIFWLFRSIGDGNERYARLERFCEDGSGGKIHTLDFDRKAHRSYLICVRDDEILWRRDW